MDKETMERLSSNLGVIQETMPGANKADITTENGVKEENPVMIFPLPEDERQAELMVWWLGTAYRDFQATMPKVQEYGGSKVEGSADLMLIGENLALLLDMHDVRDAVKQELACWFYMQGKIARLVSDYQHHRSGKADTWFDAVVYGMMARRLQVAGRWP